MANFPETAAFELEQAACGPTHVVHAYYAVTQPVETMIGDGVWGCECCVRGMPAVPVPANAD